VAKRGNLCGGLCIISADAFLFIRNTLCLAVIGSVRNVAAWRQILGCCCCESFMQNFGGAIWIFYLNLHEWTLVICAFLMGAE
jgi:hypothetical protein